jgi:ketosteroid isomerase-like protein
MSNDAALLFANEAFYRAFADRDMRAMREIWADDATTTCTHPGWAPLIGAASVLASWQAILTGTGAPDVECQAAQAFTLGDSGFVLCYERIGDDTLVATNVFVRRGSVWKMVHHHAGPLAQPIPEEADEPGEPLTPRH